MNIIQRYEAEQIARLSASRGVPDFVPGDTVRVAVKVVEGERTRTQAFEGVCIARSNKGLNSNFTVRKISYGEGVERVFPLYSPLIAEIAVVRRGDVRRAKLYYLRGRSGKSARIAERARTAGPSGEAPATPAKPKRPTDNRARPGHEGEETPCPTAKPRTLFDKIWDSHVVEKLPDGTCILYIDRHLLHEVTSPQAFEGLRHGRPQAAPAGPDDRGRRPQHPDGRRAHAVRHQGRGQPHPGADAGEERRRVRRAVHPDPRCAAGHRAHHRPGTRHQPAGHDDRLR